MDFQEFVEKYDIKLNNQQLEAVQAVNGPTLLLAVPGSGKTTALVTRLAYMIFCCGVAPESVLTLTYTVAATNDMAGRFVDTFGTDFDGRLKFRTINSICNRVIQYYSGLCGKTPFRLETNEKRLNAIVAEIYQSVEERRPNEVDIKQVRTLITYIKNMRLEGNDIELLGIEQDLKIGEIYTRYRKVLRQNGIMDFDDQMIYAYNILTSTPAVLDYFQQLYRYICVDEAQDTSKIQHEIIALLASGNENLFMVGDEDQSIYGFRAAYPQALLEFEKHHQGARVLLMEENFRSNAKIVSAADAFIKKNTLRHNKNMIASREPASNIRNIELKGRRAQYTYLLKVAQSCQSQEGDARTAVIYRNNESALPLIDLLERNDVPYCIQNKDLMFFSHRVVTDIVNIIKFAMNPRDTELFMQIYYKLNLKLKRTEAEKASAVSNAKNISVFEALEKHSGITNYKKMNVRTLHTNMRKMLEEPPVRAIARIMKSMEYADFLEQQELSDEKVNILKMLASNEATLQSFLDRLDWLRENIRTKEYDPTCNFLLTTIHGSKGLEYENVYLIDCADGLFPENVPTAKEIKEDETLLQTYEEERRMFYVAVTRARDNLTLFSLSQPSTFVRELLNLKKPEKAAQPNVPVKKKISVEEYTNYKDKFGPGIPVVHKRFGEGVVTDADDEKVSIYFEDAGEKSFGIRILYERNMIIFPMQ